MIGSYSRNAGEYIVFLELPSVPVLKSEQTRLNSSSSNIGTSALHLQHQSILIPVRPYHGVKGQHFGAVQAATREGMRSSRNGSELLHRDLRPALARARQLFDPAVDDRADPLQELDA